MDCVAIAAHVEGDFVGPCGMCRQTMMQVFFFVLLRIQIYQVFFRQTLAEFNPGIKIYLVRLDRTVKITSLSYQLPDAFTPKKLALKFYNGESNGEVNGEVNGTMNGKV